MRQSGTVAPAVAQRPSRRTFLKSGAGAALVIGVSLPLAGRAATMAGTAGTSFGPNAFLRITPDNRVTVIIGALKWEIGRAHV